MMASKYLVCLAIFLANSPAAAQTVTATDPASVAAALQSEGYAAKIETASDGDPVIRSQSSGSDFSIFFFNCTAGRDCSTVQFYAGYQTESTPALDHMNMWNKRNRFGRAYLDDENDPVIEMDVDLDDGGMSQALFVDNLQFWTAVMAGFEKHIGW